jgi:thioredoxin-dependent peroxiredoxin
VALLVGATAPTFTLPGWHRESERSFTLPDAPGRPVVLAFYPGDERLICTKQLCAYSDNLGELERFDADVWGIAPQSVESHRDFAAGRSLQMPLLSDEGRVVAKQYGVVGAFGLRRSVFVVDGDGTIAWRWVSATNVTFPGIPEIVGALLQVT